MPFPVQQIWQEWRTSDVLQRGQFEAWRAALSDSYLNWALGAPESSAFFGEIQMREFGGIRLLHCRCDPCHGWRGQEEISRSSKAYFGLLLVYDGGEFVRCGEKDQYLDKRGFLLWDSQRPVEFKSYSGLKKITLLVPQELLRERIRGVDDLTGETMDIDRGIGAVMASHLSTLVREAGRLEKGRLDAILDLTLELVAACLQGERGQVSTAPRAKLLSDIHAHIEKNLDDPDLGPGQIAAAFGISSRYLHLLFADAGVSVSTWILQRRLEQCRHELAHGTRGGTITDIAFRWGFNDSAHFCRVFKKRYGLSPNGYRKQRCS